MLPLSSRALPPALPAPEPTLGGLHSCVALVLPLLTSMCAHLPAPPLSLLQPASGPLALVLLMLRAGLWHTRRPSPVHRLPYASLDLPFKYLGGKSQKMGQWMRFGNGGKREHGGK